MVNETSDLTRINIYLTNGKTMQCSIETDFHTTVSQLFSDNTTDYAIFDHCVIKKSLIEMIEVAK